MHVKSFIRPTVIHQLGYYPAHYFFLVSYFVFICAFLTFPLFFFCFWALSLFICSYLQFFSVLLFISFNIFSFFFYNLSVTLWASVVIHTQASHWSVVSWVVSVHKRIDVFLTDQCVSVTALSERDRRDLRDLLL